jgi:hypothetical protein
VALTKATKNVIWDSEITQAKLAPGVAGTGPAFSAYAASSQTGLTSGVYTKVTLGTEDFDTDTCYDTTNSRFQPNVAGYYQINGTVYGSGTTVTSVGAKLYKNGSAIKLGSVAASVGNSLATAHVSAVVYLNGTTDYLELYGSVSASSGMQFAYGGDTSTTSHFSGAMVRKA